MPTPLKSHIVEPTTELRNPNASTPTSKRVPRMRPSNQILFSRNTNKGGFQKTEAANLRILSIQLFIPRRTRTEASTSLSNKVKLWLFRIPRWQPETTEQILAARNEWSGVLCFFKAISTRVGEYFHKLRRRHTGGMNLKHKFLSSKLCFLLKRRIPPLHFMFLDKAQNLKLEICVSFLQPEAPS